MSLSKPTNTLAKFDVIRSDRFVTGTTQPDGSTRVGTPTVDSHPKAAIDELRRVAWFVVLESSSLVKDDHPACEPTLEVRAIRLINGDIYPDSEKICFTAGGTWDERIDEVEVIGRAEVESEVLPNRTDDITVKVTLTEGAAASIASRYYFMVSGCDQAAFMIVEKQFWLDNHHISDMERGEELEDVLPPEFENASEGEFHYYENFKYESEVSDETKEKARQLLLAAGFEQIDNPWNE